LPFNKPEGLLTNNIFPSAPSAISVQSSFNPYDFSVDDEEYLTANNQAEMTPRQRNRRACLLTDIRLYLNLWSESPQY
jgi:hypothetical protein